jgi:hypothetical protein
MIYPIIAFSLFFLVVFLITYFGNKSRRKDYDILIEKIEPRTSLFIEQAKCSTMTIGLNNKNFLFNRADFYVTNDAVIILAYNKGNYLSQLSFPIIVTNNIGDYKNEFYFAKTFSPHSIKFPVNNLFKFEIGEAGILKTNVIIKIKELKENEMQAFQKLVRENNWKV